MFDRCGIGNFQERETNKKKYWNNGVGFKIKRCYNFSQANGLRGGNLLYFFRFWLAGWPDENSLNRKFPGGKFNVYFNGLWQKLFREFGHTLVFFFQLLEFTNENPPWLSYNNVVPNENKQRGQSNTLWLLRCHPPLFQSPDEIRDDFMGQIDSLNIAEMFKVLKKTHHILRWI